MEELERLHGAAGVLPAACYNIQPGSQRVGVEACCLVVWLHLWAACSAQWPSAEAAMRPAPPAPLAPVAGPRAGGAYVFAEDNPFLLDTDSFAKGRDLFRRGVLTGATRA